MSQVSPSAWQVLTALAWLIQSGAPDAAADQGPVAVRALMAITGLSRYTISRELDALVGVGVLVHLAPNDKHENLGDTYGLVLDPDLVDWATLAAQRAERQATYRKNLRRARRLIGVGKD